MGGTGVGLVGEVRQTQKDKQRMLPPSGNNNKLQQDCLKIEEGLIKTKKRKDPQKGGG